MKILYLTDSWTVHDRRFVHSLVDAGHQVDFRAVGRLPGSAGDDLSRPGVRSAEAWGADGGRLWLALPRLVGTLHRACRTLEPDVVHAGPIHRGALLAALAGCRPLVSMSWGSDLLHAARRGPARWAAPFVLHRSDSHICDCQTVRARSVALGMDPERIFVFPWGVDLDVFRPGSDGTVRTALGWHDEFVVMSARTWHPIYGVDLVAQAFARVWRRNPGMRLMLLGDGPERRRIHRHIRQGGAMARTHFAGTVRHDQLPAFFRAADLYVSAARSDGSSVTLLEALASGVPALVSDIPSNREWVEDGVNGWTFRDGDVTSLAEGLGRAVAEPDRLARMGSAARRVAEEHADWRRSFLRLLEAYGAARAAAGRGSDGD